jgi:hypothetical protein
MTSPCASVETLVVDRDAGTVRILGRGHGEGVELHRRILRGVQRRVVQADVARHRPVRRHAHRQDLYIESRIKNLQGDRPGRNVGQAKLAVLIGQDHEIGAFHPDAGVVEVATGDLILHASLNRAGRSGLGLNRQPQEN